MSLGKWSVDRTAFIIAESNDTTVRRRSLYAIVSASFKSDIVRREANIAAMTGEPVHSQLIVVRRAPIFFSSSTRRAIRS